MREAFGCLWALRARQTVAALRERFLGGAGLRRAVSAVMKQRLAALCDTRESWSMQLLCAESRGKTQRAAKLKRMIPLGPKTLAQCRRSIAPRASATPRRTPWGCSAGLGGPPLIKQSSWL